jgi:NAD+ kinase
MNGAQVPVMGINAGSLGFLTSVAAEDLDEAFEALVEDRIKLSRRALLSCYVERAGKRSLLAHALNDCVVSRGASGRIVCLELSVDGSFVADVVCDGLIVSTPTGSTAYCLSAGGPILLPSTPAMVISFICPHALGSRPLVIPEGSTVAIAVRETFAPANVSADGEVEHDLCEGDCVVVEMSDRVVTFAHMPSYDPFDVMRQKLNWHGANKNRVKRA